MQAERTKMLKEYWDQYSVANATDECDEVIDCSKLDNFVVKKLGAEDARANGMTQFKLLLSRSWREATRNPMRVKAQFFQSIMFSFIIASIWWNITDSQQGIQDRNGALFFMSANGMMSSLMGVLSTFGNERGKDITALCN